ncbi:hypothetical protein PMAYCL1PPCAC_33006, partial [Pristionchus mayeri]
ECEADPEGIRMRDGYSTGSKGECLWTANNASAPVKILVLGNSIGHLAGKILHKVLEGNKDVRELRLFTLHYTIDQPAFCAPFLETWRKMVERMQPDITLLITNDSGELRQPIADLKTDKILAAYVEFLKPLSENSKYLVLDEFYPASATNGAFMSPQVFIILRICKYPVGRAYF